MISKWDFRFMRIAKEVSTWSRDPSTKIGAVAVKDKVILSTGYNGFPRGINDDERYLNRDIKYNLVVHAEMNCIYNAALIGAKLNEADIYVYGLPTCIECAKGIAQIGIKKVFVCYPEKIGNKWIESEQKSIDLYNECGIKYIKMEGV